MRFATVITMYRKRGRETVNAMFKKIVVADDEASAIAKAISNGQICESLADDFRIFWKIAIEIPELNTETNEYELLSEKKK